MPDDDAIRIDAGLAALLAGLRAMLADAMARLAILAAGHLAGHHAGLSALEALAAAIAEKTDDLLWRTACTLAGRRDLLDLPPHLRRALIRAARGHASPATLLNTTRRANPSPRFRALMPLIARDHRRYAAAIQRRIRARFRHPQPAQTPAPSAQRNAPRKLEPG